MPDARPRVVVTHWVHPEVVTYLAGFCDPVVPDEPVRPGDGVWPHWRVAELAASAHGLITSMADTVDEAFLDGCPELCVISATLKGYDNFDAEACARRGVWLTILPDMLTIPTAELAVGLVIGIMRRIGEADQYMRGGQFAGWRPQFYGSGLHGATVGIVGMGRVGQAAASRLRAFGTRIVYHDTQVRPADLPGDLAAAPLPLPGLLAASDVVLVALPLTSGTFRLLDAAALAAMRPGTCLVNVGRGSVMDEEAVAAALHEGRLGGYAADVYAMEDWALPVHPAGIPAGLIDHPRTLFTPHLGSAVDAVRRDMSLAAARQVHQVLSGQRPDHAVNEPRARR